MTMKEAGAGIKCPGLGRDVHGVFVLLGVGDLDRSDVDAGGAAGRAGADRAIGACAGYNPRPVRTAREMRLPCQRGSTRFFHGIVANQS